MTLILRVGMSEWTLQFVRAWAWMVNAERQTVPFWGRGTQERFWRIGPIYLRREWQLPPPHGVGRQRSPKEGRE